MRAHACVCVRACYKLDFLMNDIDGVVNGPKSPTTEPRCHSDQVDPLVDKELPVINGMSINYGEGKHKYICYQVLLLEKCKF